MSPFGSAKDKTDNTDKTDLAKGTADLNPARDSHGLQITKVSITSVNSSAMSTKVVFTYRSIWAITEAATSRKRLSCASNCNVTKILCISRLSSKIFGQFRRKPLFQTIANPHMTE